MLRGLCNELGKTLMLSPLIGPSSFVPTSYLPLPRATGSSEPTEIVSELPIEPEPESESDCGTRSQRKLSWATSQQPCFNPEPAKPSPTPIETRHGANCHEGPRTARDHLIPNTGRGPHCRWKINYNCRPDGLEGRSLVGVPSGRTEGHHAYGGKRCHR